MNFNINKLTNHLAFSSLKMQKESGRIVAELGALIDRANNLANALELLIEKIDGGIEQLQVLEGVPTELMEDDCIEDAKKFIDDSQTDIEDENTPTPTLPKLNPWDYKTKKRRHR